MSCHYTLGVAVCTCIRVNLYMHMHLMHIIVYIHCRHTVYVYIGTWYLGTYI